MPDKIVKSVETVISARDDSAAGIASFEDRMKKMADDVPQYVTGRSATDNAILDRMGDFYRKQNEAAKKAAFGGSILPLVGDSGPSIADIQAAADAGTASEPAGREAGRTFGQAAADEGERSFIEGLKTKFGRGSAAGELAHILEGAGPILAIGLGAREFAELGGEISKLDQGLADGSIKAADMSERLIGAVPIIGDLYKGAKDLGEAMLGIGEDSARWNQSLKDAEGSYSSILSIIKEADKFVKESQRRVNGPASASEQANIRADDAEATIKASAGKERGVLRTRRGQLNDIMAGPENTAAQQIAKRKASEELKQINADIAANEKTQSDAIAKIEAQRRNEQASIADKDRDKRIDDYWKDRQEMDKADEKSHDAQQKAQGEADAEFYKAAQREADEQDRAAKHQIEIGEQLRRMKIDELRTSGSLSQADEKRLTIADRYLEKQKQLQSIMADPDASAAQRADAQSRLGRLADEESTAERGAVRSPRHGTASAENAGDLHGLIEQATERAADPNAETAQNTKANLDVSKRIADALDNIRGMLALTHGSSPALIKAV